MKRVVITGMAALSPLGLEWTRMRENFQHGQSAVRAIPEWSEFQGLRSSLGGAVRDFELPAHYDRKKVRSMSRGALLATRATELAIDQAGLRNDPTLTSGETGVAFGSCLGGSEALIDLAARCARKEVRGTSASSYLQVMSHSCAVNIGIFFGIKGRVIPSCSACTSGSQAIGFAYETIRHGLQRAMIAGGAEELCVAFVSLFDAVCATSPKKEGEAGSPRPFDQARDGLVVGEGAGALVLEDLESAQARGAPILAEIVGFGTNSDGAHITNPDWNAMRAVIESGLTSAQLSAKEIGYVHAHATGTDQGDIAESKATYEVFGDRAAVGATKSYMGHTLGACGAIEALSSISMMNENWFAPILHLDNPDSRCAPLQFIRDKQLSLETEHVMNNNFAFGGVNTSLIFRRWV